MKYGRIFSMKVQGVSGNTYTIQSPLTVRFRVQNDNQYGGNPGMFQIYNLTQAVRNDLYTDAYMFNIYRHIEFAAGYQANVPNPGAIQLPIIFSGNILTAYSYRQGPDWITEINAIDGQFAIDNGIISLTKPSPWTIRDMLNDVVAQMPRVKLGLIGAFDIKNYRGLTFTGNPWDLITHYIAGLEGEAYINKEKVYIMQHWEYIQDNSLLPIISDDVGMIGTPRSQSGLVIVRMLFEPRLEVAQQVQLQTPSIPRVILRNGLFKILRLVHAGTISGAVCESLETEVTLYQPNRGLELAAAA